MDSSQLSFQLFIVCHTDSVLPLNVQLYNCNQDKGKFLCFTYQGKIKSVK